MVGEGEHIQSIGIIQHVLVKVYKWNVLFCIFSLTLSWERPKGSSKSAGSQASAARLKLASNFWSKNILWNVLTGGRVCRAVDSLLTARCSPRPASPRWMTAACPSKSTSRNTYTVNRHSRNSVPFSLSLFHTFTFTLHLRLPINSGNLNP